MNPMRRILGDRQAAGLLAGLLAYLLIVQAALAGAVCSMAAPQAGETVICTLHGLEDGGSVPLRDCQCQVGCQHCGPPALDVPAASGVARATAGEAVWNVSPARIVRSAERISSNNPRAPPLISA